jgi:hypothetical protein
MPLRTISLILAIMWQEEALYLPFLQGWTQAIGLVMYHEMEDRKAQIIIIITIDPSLIMNITDLNYK